MLQAACFHTVHPQLTKQSHRIQPTRLRLEMLLLLSKHIAPDTGTLGSIHLCSRPPPVPILSPPNSQGDKEIHHRHKCPRIDKNVPEWQYRHELHECHIGFPADTFRCNPHSGNCFPLVFPPAIFPASGKAADPDDLCYIHKVPDKIPAEAAYKHAVY